MKACNYTKLGLHQKHVPKNFLNFENSYFVNTSEKLVLYFAKYMEVNMISPD